MVEELKLNESKTDMDNASIFAQRLNDLIQNYSGGKLTNKALADAIHVDRTTLSKYRSGEIVPSTEVLFQIANFFGVTMDWLYGREGAIQSTHGDVRLVCETLGLSEDAYRELVCLRLYEDSIPSLSEAEHVEKLRCITAKQVAAALNFILDEKEQHGALQICLRQWRLQTANNNRDMVSSN